MTENTPFPTEFLPAEKDAPEEIERQAGLISGASGVVSVLDGIIGFAIVLNRRRQAIFLNRPVSEFFRSHGISDAIGSRTGDLLGCAHAKETPGGCGTTRACRHCGSARSIAAALDATEEVRECRILSRTSGEELDLRVKAGPFQCHGEHFLLMSFLDISSDKRRRVLERIFFHDIINTAGGVRGLLTLMQDMTQEEVRQYLPPTLGAADTLVDQILSQKDLAAAEHGELKPSVEEVTAAGLLESVAALFRAHDVARDRTIAVEPCASAPSIRTDRVLLARVIGNMVKNALEAEKAGAVITLACAELPGGGVRFSVRNPTQMPEEVRLQVFQRSFSSKGSGRGLGTYSMRLLTERYLKGRVQCSSDAGGTEFFAEYPAAI